MKIIAPHFSAVRKEGVKDLKNAKHALIKIIAPHFSAVRNEGVKDLKHA